MRQRGTRTIGLYGVYICCMSMSAKKRNVTGKKTEKHEAEKVSTSFEESDDWEMTSCNPSMTSVGPSVEKGVSPSAVNKGKGPFVEKGKGPLVEKGKGSSVEKGKSSSVEEGECSGVSTSSPGSSSHRDDSPSIIAYVHNV